MRKTSHLPALQKIRYLGIRLAKDVEDLYTENCNTIVKEMEENTRKWKDIPCSQTIKINSVKISMLPEGIYRVNGILIKIPMAFFREIEQKILKFVW